MNRLSVISFRQITTMLVFCLVIFVCSNGILVNSASVKQDGPMMILPFYSLKHAYNNSQIKGSDVGVQLITLGSIAERLYNNTNHTKSEFLETDEDPFLDLETIYSVAMDRTSIGDVEIQEDYTRGPNLYQAMTFFRKAYDVCLGFPSAPATHTADVVIYWKDSSAEYYLKQINLMVNKENGDIKSLEVFSVFVRRGVNELDSFNTTRGIIVAQSRWVYSLNTTETGDVAFDLKVGQAEAYYLHKEGDSPDSRSFNPFNFAVCFIVLVFIRL